MATKEVEMKDVQKEKEEKQELTKEEKRALFIGDLRKQVSILEKASQQKETRYISRVIRALGNTRRNLSVSILKELIGFYFVGEEIANTKKELLGYLEKCAEESNDMDVISKTEEKTTEKPLAPPSTLIPEIEFYFRLLVNIFLIDQKKNSQAISCAESNINRLQFFNRRTLNQISGKIFFYYSLSFELENRSEEIRSNLLANLRTATLKHNDDAQPILLNLLLRNYLQHNLYDQADKLLSKTTFKESAASSNQHARYLYYQGLIKTIQLDYTQAETCLFGAIGKAPSTGAIGFRLAVHKHAILVQLLTGEIPDRQIFRQPDLEGGLVPYLKLTQSVRAGSLIQFNQVVQHFTETFKRDKVFNLIQRLRQDVIKTGLRIINSAYSRISFKDICTKLHLDSVEDAEFIVSKAIRDGVISARINHEGGYIESESDLDVYSTSEPQSAFHKRITFCLKIHNEAVKAMRFPENRDKAVDTVDELREREQEIAKSIVDDEDEDDF